MKLSNTQVFWVSILGGLLMGLTYHWLSRTTPSESSAVEQIHYVQSAPGKDRSSLLPNSFHNAVITAAPAVVSIYTEQISPWNSQLNDPLFNSLFGDDGHLPVNRVLTNQGSGVIISPDGYIITNEHLVDKVDKITVILSDGRQFNAQKIGADSVTDLAVLKIDSPGSLAQIRLAEKETLRVGDVVLAIGNPYGVGQTVTMGIVSATGRKNVTDTLLQDFIQIDAAINPGNSGGALVNPYGELVGINTAVYAPKDGAQGIGFAVPLRLVNYVIPQIIEHQQVQRGWLGLQVDDLLYYPDLYSRNKQGAVITGVFESSPAAEAGLLRGDMITHVNGQLIANAHQLLLETTTTRPGTKITIRGLRQFKELLVEATLTKRPD